MVLGKKWGFVEMLDDACLYKGKRFFFHFGVYSKNSTLQSRLPRYLIHTPTTLSLSTAYSTPKSQKANPWSHISRHSQLHTKTLHPKKNEKKTVKKINRLALQIVKLRNHLLYSKRQYKRTSARKKSVPRHRSIPIYSPWPRK